MLGNEEFRRAEKEFLEGILIDMQKIDRVADPDGDRKVLALHDKLIARHEFIRKFITQINAARLEPEEK